MQVGLSAFPSGFCCLPGCPHLPSCCHSKHAQHSRLRSVPFLQASVQLGSAKGLTGAVAIDLGQPSLPEHAEAVVAGRQGACTGLGYSADGSLLASAWSAGLVSCCARCHCWCSAAMHCSVACDRRNVLLHCCRTHFDEQVSCGALC